MSNTISYFDNDENYYHGFLTGLLRGAGLFVTSNREHGLGRPDLIIENSSQKKVVIIEIKHTKKYEQLEAAANIALKQIENKKYGIEFMQDIITIVKYGIAFWKKESFVQVSQDTIEKNSQRSQLEAKIAKHCQ